MAKDLGLIQHSYMLPQRQVRLIPVGSSRPTSHRSHYRDTSIFLHQNLSSTLQ